MGLFVVLKCWGSRIVNSSKVRKQCQRCAFCTIKRVDTWHHTQIFAEVTGKPTSVPHIPSFSIFVTQRQMQILILVVLVVRRFWCTPWKGRTWWKWGTRKAGQLKMRIIEPLMLSVVSFKYWTNWSKKSYTVGRQREVTPKRGRLLVFPHLCPHKVQTQTWKGKRSNLEFDMMWYNVIRWFDLPHQLPWHVSIHVAKHFWIFMFACLTWAFQQPMWGIASEADKAFAAWRNAMKWSDRHWSDHCRIHYHESQKDGLIVDASRLFTFGKRQDMDFFCGLWLRTLFVFLQNVHRAAGCLALAVFLLDEVH